MQDTRIQSLVGELAIFGVLYITLKYYEDNQEAWWDAFHTICKGKNIKLNYIHAHNKNRLETIVKFEIGG